MDELPIDAVLPELRAALRAEGRVVLVAPPGAGKTTRVPLALMPEVAGKIVMLEPRRLAARAAAARLAEGGGPGEVGLRMRGESRAGSRIEVVTEGVLTRMLQADPALDGVGCVIFDEFHERSLNADLGLALTWQARGLLRPDLRIVVMSATLDAGPVAVLLGGAPVVVAEGRAFPVEARWLPRPLPAGARLEAETAALVRQALAEPGGTVLVFLPGEAEIRRVQALLGDAAEVLPLFGALPEAAQRAALAPPGARRRVVLATAIAETSLTIPGVTAVVDAGRARRARVDPGTGLTRLVTERASRAEAAQRAGRAGRVAPGVAWKLWAKAEEGAMPAHAPPEIASADLTGLALELAAWGAEAGELAFLTPPPEGALAEARALLARLGALDGGAITAHGRAMAALPTHPRLAHMLLIAGRDAAPIAALVEGRPSREGGADATARLAALRGTPEVARLARLAPPAQGLSPGAAAALAWPDRIGRRRPGPAPRYVLTGGRGAVIAEGDPLGRAEWIVALDLDGAGREARLRMGLPVDEADLRALFADRIVAEDVVAWSDREGRVIARRRARLDAVTLAETPLGAPDPEAVAEAAWEGLRRLGLPWTPAAARLRARIALAGLGPVDDDALLADGGWLRPWLGGLRTAADLRGLDLSPALLARAGGQGRLDAALPASVATPLGRRLTIDWDAETPTVEAKVQELFGMTAHPVAAGRPLRLVLLSPAGRPVAVTTDLPGFWRSGYADVRRDLRGRYPRHPWPDDPTAAAPTTRAKPRGT